MVVQNQTHRSPSFKLSAASSNILTDEDIMPIVGYGKLPQPNSSFKADDRQNNSRPDVPSQTEARPMTFSQDEETRAGLTPQNLSSKESTTEGAPDSKAHLMS
jgi:hypothetical protein